MYFLPKENVLDAEKNECFTILVVNVIELIEKIDPDPKPNRLSFHTLRAPTTHTHSSPNVQKSPQTPSKSPLFPVSPHVQKSPQVPSQSVEESKQQNGRPGPQRNQDKSSIWEANQTSPEPPAS